LGLTLREAHAGARADCTFTGISLPTPDNGIDVMGIDLNGGRASMSLFRGDDSRAGSCKRVKNNVAAF